MRYGNEFPKDDFTESDVLGALEANGLRYKNGSRYILTQCPLHADENASAQIYKDDWFVKCHAGCEGGRFHITKAFPHLRKSNYSQHAEGGKSFSRPVSKSERKTTVQGAQNQMNYTDKSSEIMAMWESLPPIPDSHQFKNLPIDVLNDLGWRYDATHERYLIPYWSRSKKSLSFAQWRNLKQGPRFNFWKDARPTMYGTWNLEPGQPIFLVEGCSDAAVMQYCGVPWIAAPSASSGELVKMMAPWCLENDILIVYAGDNDEAGDKLKEALDECRARYRRRQPRKPYKDWADMYEAEGLESVQDYCFSWLSPVVDEPVDNQASEDWDTLSPIERVQSVFPGAVQLTLVDREQKVAPPAEQQSTGNATLPF